MRVGIITYHRAENYGSVLQTYALSKTIEKIGYTSLVIDYHTSKQDELYKKYDSPKSIMGIGRNIHTLCFSKQIEDRKNRFSRFLQEYISLTESDYNEQTSLVELNDQFDCFVCGSDQIWNASCADFSDAYLLSFVEDKKRCMSYAASIGRDSISEDYKNKFQVLVRGYEYISVREDVARTVLEPLTGRSVDVVPDPVLLLTREEWDSLIESEPIKEDYILCYFIGDVAQMRSFANDLHRRTKMPLVLLNINLRDLFLPGKRRYDTGPLEFIRLIRDAKYVCTNSFHATLFSLIYHKDFWTFTSLGDGTSKSRIEQILKSARLTDRIINTNTGLPSNVLQSIDFECSDDYIKNYSLYGLKKLTDALSSIENYNQQLGTAL